MHREIVVMHEIRMDQVPRMCGSDFQCMMSSPELLPKKDSIAIVTLALNFLNIAREKLKL